MGAAGVQYAEYTGRRGQPGRCAGQEIAAEAGLGNGHLPRA